MTREKTKPAERSLYQCFNARVKTDKICCANGWPLGVRKDGTIDLIRLMRGDPLECSGCQECVDFDCMGGPVAPEDRGWIDKEALK